VGPVQPNTKGSAEPLDPLPWALHGGERFLRSVEGCPRWLLVSGGQVGFGNPTCSAEPNLASLSRPMRRLYIWMACDASSGGYASKVGCLFAWWAHGSKAHS
jgi:hypothetical protein